MRFVLSGAAVCVLTAGSIPGALRYLPLRSCSRRFGALFSAGYALAAFGGFRCAKFSNRHALLADSIGIQPLCAATLAEAALAFGISAIARTARPGCGYDLIDERSAGGVTRHNLDEFRD